MKLFMTVSLGVDTSHPQAATQDQPTPSMPAVHKSGLRRFADALGVIALAAVFLLISANAAF
jgi:hypothetical protein